MSDKTNTDYTEALHLDALGYLSALGEDYDQAIEDFTKAIQHDPDYADAYINRGNVYFIKKEFDMAITDWKSALEIDPNNNTAKEGIEMLAKFEKENNNLN